MPSYYFHLSFELSPSPDRRRISEEIGQGSVYLPPAGTDIFKARLPDHPRYSDGLEGSDGASYRTSRASATARLSSGRDKGASSVGEALPSRQVNGRASHDQVSRSRHDRLPNPAIDLAAGERLAASSTPADWRFDRVSIESIDMAPAASQTDGRTGGKAVSYMSNGLGAGSGGLAAKARFVPLDSRNTELGWGVVHLYRDAAETPGLYDDVGDGTSSRRTDGGAHKASGADEVKKVDDEDCSTLCILAVPAYLTPSDFLGFVGEKTREMVSHFRMIRTGRTNRYMVLMKFRSPKKARQWRREWNGKVFNSMEPENCHVVFVKSIHFQTPGQKGDTSSFPDIKNDPFTPRNESSTASATAIVPPSSLTTKPLAPPTPALVELPTCPVCLERMDETTGLLTILCQHVFHCACLQKWRGSGCPVCRYKQGDGLVAGHRAHGSAEDEATDSYCSVCRSEANLWICLICGNVGCGRYDEAHAFSHHQESSHCYAMDVDTQRVWDYGGDGYVHRLIQDKSDGKLVELPSHNPGSVARGEGRDETAAQEKLDDIGMEYTHLLTSQLDSQRQYFEEKVAQAADKASEASRTAEAAAASASRATEALSRLEGAHDALVKETMPALEREKARAERRAEKATETMRKTEREWREERAMNASLLERVELLGKEVAAARAEKAELEEQNRDLSFFISGQAKLDGLGEEVQEGTVRVGEAPGTTTSKRKGKGKGRR